MFLHFFAVDETSSSASTEVTSNQTRNDSEEKWSKIVRKEGKQRTGGGNGQAGGEPGNENWLRFEGIIYGFPGSAPGSQYVLRASVHVDRVDTGNMQVKRGFGVNAEKTLSGKIIHRKQKIGGAEPLGVDFVDGKIPVMKEFPAYHYRKRRNVFLEHISQAKKNNGSSISTMSSANNNNNSSSTGRSSGSVDENVNKSSSSGVAFTTTAVSSGVPSPLNSDNQTKSAKLKEGRVGTSAKIMAAPPPLPASLVKLSDRRSRRSVAERRSTSPAAPTTYTGTLSSNPNLHGFTTWDSFVKITSRDNTRVRNNRKRKTKRSSTWSSLL